NCRMARDETSISTLSFEKRTQQLNSKFAILNRDFVRFLCDEVSNDAEVDLTPTVKSYMDNVKDLRKMYNLETKEGEKRERDGENVRKKVTARRRLKGEGESSKEVHRTLPSIPKTPQLKMSTPAGLSAPSKLEMSADISAISPFGGCNSALNKTEESDATLKALPPTIGAPSGGAGGRKRAIRGGGPLGDGESVVFRGATESSIAAPTITVKPPPILFELPKATAGFWNTKPSAGDKKEEKKEEMKEDEKKEGEKGDEKKEEIKPFSFGSTAAPKFTGFNFGGIAASSSSTESPANKPPPSTGAFSLFAAPTSSSSASTSSTPTLTFGLAQPSGGMKVPPFASSATATTANEGEGEEEGEYVPPKAEVVENKEEDAKISLKCAVFKLEGGEYTKMGVGQLYVKENEGKSSLLVRAATAIGTIWVNGRIDGTMKAEKATDDKIRVTVPVSASEMKTFLIRIGRKEDADKVLSTLKDGGAK
ncbi:hypothetical protein PMAYCL1PPCAC_12567, partial [Pristionchus mayeri]